MRANTLCIYMGIQIIQVIINRQSKMGCSDSTAMENHLNIRNQNTLNPHQYPYDPNSNLDQTNEQLPPSQLKLHTKSSQFLQNNKKSLTSNNEDLFQNSEEYLQELYAYCEGNLQKFFGELQQKISEIYMSISKDTLEQMNQNVLINNESKIQISQEILWFNLNILKVASRKNEHQFNPTIFKQINKLQKNLVGYLKMKYPRGGQSFVPGDLMAVFKEFDLSEDLQFDILKNANVYFGSDNDADLSRDIKTFLNKIMNQLDSNYPKFEKIMQERVFVVEGEDGEKKTLNYKIGRKIPQNVPKYTDLQNNTLQINSPQIFRVIIKWMQYLEQVLVAPNQNINKKKNFKCFIEQNQKGQNIYDEINEDEYFDLINFDLIDKIEKEKANYHESNQVLLKDMDRFNSHLIKLLDTSVRKQKFVPVREMETIKYSNLNAKFIAWVLGEKLMLALKKLIKVGKSFYDTRSMLNLDLIQFKVSDLMRSMVSGSKKQILAVYANLKNLEKEGVIKIIKIKNRLGTSLNDAMLIFAIKGTFLICEIQLILSDSTQKVNQKYKNVQLLNHFFYELQRSPYGILSEIAVLLAYKDSKMSYEDNITFELHQIDISACEKSHPESVLEIKDQTKPFICTICTKFYFKFENIFLMKHCEKCNVFVCAKCIFGNDKELQKNIVNRQLSTEIQRIVAKTLTKLRDVKSSTGASTILQIFESPFKRLQELFGKKKVQPSKLIEYLNTRVKNTQDDLYFVIVNFKTGRASIKQLLFKPAWKEIQNPFNPSQVVFPDKKPLFYTNYDLILFYNAQSIKKQNKEIVEHVQQNMLHLYISQQDLRMTFYRKTGLSLVTLKVVDFRLVINIQNSVKKENNEVSQQQRQDASWKSWKNKCTKTFKYASLHEATAGLPDLAGAKSLLKLSDLGIIDVHLQFFKEINWSASIKELKLSKNKLTSVAMILQVCTGLQRLYINENYIKDLTFTKQLSVIEIINAVNNSIAKIAYCQKIKNISKFLLEGNQLEEFPKSQFPNLKILSLKRNPIINFSNVYNSTLPNIQQMYLDYEEENEISYNRPNNEVDLEKVVLPFEKLKSIQSESNFKSISIDSIKIERINFYRNNLKEIELKTLQNLKYLTLSNNQIQNIDFLFSSKNDFENNSIVEINLKVNLIKDLPVMKSTSLIKADFSNNQISSITNLTSSSLLILVEIQLSKNMIPEIPEVTLPKLQKMNLAQNPILKMNKLESSKLQSLEMLDFAECGTIESFPLLSMPKLTQIALSFTQINEMNNLSTSNLPNLKKLTLSFCTIENFPILTIDSLEYMDLNSSSIKNLINLEKSQLKSLKTLVMNYVQIESEEALQINDFQTAQEKALVNKKPEKPLSNVFTCNFSFPNLEHLKLDGANFKNVLGLQRCNLPILQELSINSCIFSINPKFRLKNLKRIHAVRSQIITIQSILTHDLSSLEAIYMGSNMIEKVVLTMPKLKIVDFSVNKITQFSHVGDLNELEQLNLDSNNLTKFPILKAPALKKLIISGNPFEDITNLGLSKLDSLEELRFASCNLSGHPLPVINLAGLKSFYMMENQLKDISNLSLSSMPLVEDITLSDNEVQIIPILKFPSLKFLRMNRNKLTNIGNLEHSQCPQLTIMEFETNLIKVLPMMPFPSLTKIFMHENQLVSVQGFNKSEIKNFEILNLCSSKELAQWPYLKCNFEEIYLNETKIMNPLKLNDFKGLKKLQLNGNNIEFLPKLNLKDAQMIQFQDNLLKNIDEFAQNEYPECQQFAVKGNQITSIPLLKMQKLKRAYFTLNQIQDIDKFLQGNNPLLQTLTFETNCLKKVKKMPYPNLTDVYFTNNPDLEELTCFNLAQYPQLRMIVAASTSIKKVQKLPKLPSLEKIWVNNSKVTDLSWFAESASNLPKLYFFNGSQNQIKNLPALNFESLNSLYLSGNPIEDFNQFLAMDATQFGKFHLCQVSIKTSEEEYENQVKLLAQKGVYISLIRFYL